MPYEDYALKMAIFSTIIKHKMPIINYKFHGCVNFTALTQRYFMEGSESPHIWARPIDQNCRYPKTLAPKNGNKYSLTITKWKLNIVGK